MILGYEAMHSRSARFSALLVLITSLCRLLIPGPVVAQSPEFRGMWVNGWNAGFQNSSQVTALVNQTRAANCNTIVAQVRRRGDAFYNSNFEPHVTGTSPADFDALADLLAKAHNTSSGPYVEVHAWMVTYHIWSGATNATTPPQPNHPLRLHPDWLLQDASGNMFIGNQYTFDPGHPQVQLHTYNVTMDLVTNYNVDGINFDYIRYSSADEGYNPVTVARFNQRFGRSGSPLPTDLVWKQFRRDQITGLLRKIYLNAIAVRPGIKVSCDTITWAPGPANVASWYSSSAAWNSVLQDWRGWMEEGIVDLNIPMAYFDQAGAYTSSWTNWVNFTRDHQYSRQAAIGPGIYLNSIADAIAQMRFTRTASPSGNRTIGVCGYDYNTPFEGGGGQFATFHTYLTNSPNAYDSVPGGLFPAPVPVPAMPWKLAPIKGHIKGTVYGGGITNALDGAVVTLLGAASRIQTNDATGFYGFVDLTPGTYRVTASFPGYPPQTNNVVVTAGVVSTVDLILSVNGPPYLILEPSSVTTVEGSHVPFAASASGAPPLSWQWRFNGFNIPGATRSDYTRQAVQPSDAGAYSVAVTNAFGFALSSNALLTVISQPVIQSHPQSQSVVLGTDVTFAVSATGTAPLAYQWRRNSTDLPGATGSSYSVLNAQPADQGTYSVVVSNAAGTRVSSNATLTVSQAALPPRITEQPRSMAAAPSQDVSFTVNANGALPFVYRWSFNGSAVAGATTSVLMLKNVTTNNSGSYAVVISNSYGAVTSQAATLHVLPFFKAAGLAPLWSLAPGSRPYLTVSSLPTERGMAYNPVTDRLIVVSRAGPKAYVLNASTGADLHELNVSGISGGTYPLLMIGVADDGAVYAGNLTTAGATTAFKLYRWANDAPSTVATVAFSGDPSPGNNQRWGDTLDVRGAGSNTQVIIGSRSGTNAVVFTTSNGSTFTPCNVSVNGASGSAFGLGIAFGTGNSFWGKASGTALRQVGFDLGTGDGNITRTHGTPEIPSTLAPIGVSTSLNLLAGINISSPNHLRLYDLTPSNGTPVFIASTNFPADNDNTSAGTGAIDFGGDRVFALESNNGILAMRILAAVPTAPFITTAPLSQTVRRGSNAVFSVSAQGTGPLSYQWQFNRANLAGATAITYTHLNVQATNAGQYGVTVSNAVGTASSVPANLTVLLPGPASLTGVDLSNGVNQVHWTADPGFVYTLQWSTNLSFWSDLALVGSATAVYQYTDWQATNHPARFYRVRD